MQNGFILIAENDSDDQLFLASALRENSTSLQPVFFPNGVELLQFLCTQTDSLPTAIFLDLNMPRMTGMEALLEIKSRNEFDHIPVIIISTSNNIYEIEKCRAMGANDFLVKPNTYRQLSDSLKNILSTICAC